MGVKHQLTYLLTPRPTEITDTVSWLVGVQIKVIATSIIVQELCESRGGRPELSVLTNLLVSVDVKNY